jgi:hypothetical protein
MNKSVPTLLGIVIILLVVVLVVLLYNYKMTQEIGKGGVSVGTIGGEMLTGVEQPKETIGTAEVLGAKRPGAEVRQGARRMPTSRLPGRVEGRRGPAAEGRRGRRAR